MSFEAARGGGNCMDIFAQTAGVASTLQISFQKIRSTDLSGHPQKGIMKVNLDQATRNTASLAFLDAALGKAEPTEIRDDYEDASYDVETGGVDTLTKYIGVWYGGLLPDSTREIRVGRGVFTGDTGNTNTVAGGKGTGNNPVEFTFIDGVAVTVGSDLVNSLLIGTPVDLTVSSLLVGCILTQAAA